MSRIICLIPLLLTLLVGCDELGTATYEPGEVPGVSDNEILLGSSLALTGHAGYLGTQTLRGAEAYIHSVNDSGGVFGRTIRIIAKDDAYDPPRCLANTQRFLIDGDVFALFCYVGTPTTVTVLPLLDEAKVPLLGMFTGANALREPFNRYAINIRASYYQETEAAVHHLVKELGFKRIAVFYQYDAYGFDGLVGAELALKRFGLEPVSRSSYIRGTLNVEEAVTKTMTSGADAVVMIGTYSACAKFIRVAANEDFNPIFYNVSFVGAEELARLLGPLSGVRVVMSQVVPPPVGGGSDNDEDVVGLYQNILEQYYPGETPSFVGLEGFLNARILVEGLRRAGPNLTQEGFIDAIESIRDFKVGPDTAITFGPRDHQGMDRVYFTRLEDGSFRHFDNWSVLHNVEMP